MAKGKHRLTATEIKNAKAAGLYPDGDGLYLQVSVSPDTKHVRKSWILRYVSPDTKKRREMGLGSAGKIALGDARTLAEAARRRAGLGIDPIGYREQEASERQVAAAQATTFRDAAAAYVEAHRSSWKSAKHAAQWTATLETYAYPVFGDLPVSSIDVGMVMKVLDPIWTAKTETASRVRGRIEMEGDAETITQKAIEMAKDGDITAIRLVLERIAPARKDGPVTFNLPPIDELADLPAVQLAILKATATGDLTPSEANAISTLVEGFRRSKESTEILKRLEALEADDA